MTARRRALAAISASAVVCTLAGCGLIGQSQSVTVNALWFSQPPQGPITAGVTKVDVGSSTDGDSESLVVDLTGLANAGAGPQWMSAAWSAATVATMQSRADPRNLEVSYAVGEQIDGPSGGAVMAVGALASLAGETLPADVALTGTVLPDGGIGPVSGIPAKVRGAAAQGIKRVLIPQGQRVSSDPGSAQLVDVVALGKTLGVEVSEVESVSRAYELMTGKPPPKNGEEPPPIDSQMTKVLSANATEILRRTSDSIVAPAPTPDMVSQRAEVVALLDRNQGLASEALLVGRDMEAFTLAGAAERALQVWNERAEAVSDAQTVGVAKTAARLTNQGNVAADQILRGTARFASTPVVFQEQLVGLPDALSWGVDALTETRAANRQLESGPEAKTAKGLGQIAAELEEARYDSEVYQGVSVKALMETGAQRIENRDESIQFLDSYADLLAQAADANTEYLLSLDPSLAGISAHDKLVLAEGKENWDLVKDAVSQPLIITKTSQAISRFIDTSAVVATVGVTQSTAGGQPSRTVIAARQTFNNQTKLASQTNDSQARVLAASSLDSSYLRWGNVWGEQLARSEGNDATADQLRLEGLTYQWFSNVQTYMLASLNSSV